MNNCFLNKTIGASINEANYSQSKADFIAKLHIALKETAETEYWLKLLTMSEYISEDMEKSLLDDCLDIENPVEYSAGFPFLFPMSILYLGRCVKYARTYTKYISPFLL